MKKIKTLSDLWKLRMYKYSQRLGKYTRLIVNDHFMIIIMVILAFGALYYQQLLSELKSGLANQHYAIILIFCLGIIMYAFQMGSPLWLTHESDKSYLFAQGEMWSNYWLKGTLIGLIPSLLLLNVIVGLIYPFLILVSNWQASYLSLFLLLTSIAHIESALFIYLNIYSLGGRIKSHTLTQWDYALIWTSILMVTSQLPKPYNILLLVVILLLGAIYISCCMYRKNSKLINFEYVVDQELKREATFYRWISFFVDVPRVAPKVKRRRYLDGILKVLKSLTNRPYSYLVVRKLFRNNAYSGVWFKLTSFFLIMILAVDSFYLSVILGIIAEVLTVIQLIPLLRQVSNQPILSLYPYKGDDSLLGTRKILNGVLLSQIIVLSLGVGFKAYAIVIVLSWVMVATILNYLYLPYWMKKHKK